MIESLLNWHSLVFMMLNTDDAKPQTTSVAEIFQLFFPMHITFHQIPTSIYNNMILKDSLLDMQSFTSSTKLLSALLAMANHIVIIAKAALVTLLITARIHQFLVQEGHLLTQWSWAGDSCHVVGSFFCPSFETCSTVGVTAGQLAEVVAGSPTDGAL